MFQTQVVRMEGLKDLTSYSLEPKSGFSQGTDIPMWWGCGHANDLVTRIRKKKTIYLSSPVLTSS